MTEPAREQQEVGIERFKRLYLGGAVLFVVLAALFYFDIVPFGDGRFAAMWLGAGAVVNVLTVLFMVPRMRANLDKM